MIVIRHIEALPKTLRGGAAALGNFDGVHPGHRVVIGRAVATARAAGAPAGIVTFEPHPRSYFRPADPPYRLTPFRTKMAALAALGLDFALVLTFDRALAELEARAFVDRFLIDGLAASAVLVGEDFHFGRGRGGDPALLRALGPAAGFAVEIVRPQRGADGAIYSSSAIRAALQAGEPAAAAAWLGRPYRIEGHVRHGDKRGRVLGYPTANLAPGDYLMPRAGIYAVHATIDGVRRDAVASLGWRPTFGGTDARLETFIFDFAGDLYGKRLAVDFIAFLRPEAKFDDLEALKAQMAQDCLDARAALAIAAHR